MNPLSTYFPTKAAGFVSLTNCSHDMKMNIIESVSTCQNETLSSARQYDIDIMNINNDKQFLDNFYNQYGNRYDTVKLI